VPPNSAVLVTTGGKEQLVVAALAHPVCDASGALSFDTALLPDISSNGRSVYPPRPRGEPPARFERAIIFVDANGTVWPPLPGCETVG
jgi:hypothetical protein